MSLVRTPLFFGPEPRSLFGWYHAPADDTPRDLGVVICPPVGHEYVNSHRTVRHLADRFAATGVPALRFDYDGTGDSSGHDEDPARVTAWIESVRCALDTVRSISGCERVAMVGIRLGAAVAAAVAETADLESLVLWAPCARGRAFVREMKALHLTGGTRHERAETHIEPGGFVMTADTQRDVACIDLRGSAPRAARVLIVARNDVPADPALRDTWGTRGITVDQVLAADCASMFEAPHNAVVPHDTIAQIVAWTVRGTSCGEAASTSIRPRQEQFVTHDGVRVRESLVRFGAGDRLFGILSEPADGAKAAPAILLPNAGSTHHVGPNRLYVFLARALSAAGFRCLRFDLAGLGDSVADDGVTENDPYPSTASTGLAAAMAAMRARGAASSFVLMGLCSGAHASFHAALELSGAAIAECVLINPLTFYYKLGAPLDLAESNHYYEWQRYMRSMRSLAGWGKLLRDDVHLADIARTVAERLRDRLASQLRTLSTLRRRAPAGDGGPNEANNLSADVAAIAESGKQLTFVFSRFDPGYDLLMINAGRVVKRLRKGGRVAIWRVNDANHTFEAKRSRLEVIDLVRNHLVSRYLA